MPTPSGEPQRFTNPLIDHDIPDPDAIALRSGGYALVASSFDRAPGLPLWHSDDLMTWRPVGHAGGFRPDSAFEGGVWAPSIREHDEMLYIVWGDPDVGIFVTDAAALEGPWSEPRLLQAGTGLIDACPYWDEDGTAWILHGYAKSRAGFNNRLDVFEADSTLTAVRGPSRTVIDGDDIPGCTVLEGPKAYRRGAELWIFAPAGGVATGWQYAFRAPDWDGPWEHRIVLAQGDTAVNGPHQGAWVPGSGDEAWFLHFQAKGALGRVLHMQPLGWDAEGWPVIGDPARPGVPVLSWQTPREGTTPAPALWTGDDFSSDWLSPAWHARGEDREKLAIRVGHGRLTVAAHPDGALLQPLDGRLHAIEVTVLRSDATSAAFVISDAVERELRVLPTDGRTGAEVVTRTPDSDDDVEVFGDDAANSGTSGVRIGVRIAGTQACFLLNGRDIGTPFTLQGRRWTGAEWGLAARGSGHVEFGSVEASV